MNKYKVSYLNKENSVFVVDAYGETMLRAIEVLTSYCELIGVGDIDVVKCILIEEDVQL